MISARELIPSPAAQVMRRVKCIGYRRQKSLPVYKKEGERQNRFIKIYCDYWFGLCALFTANLVSVIIRLNNATSSGVVHLPCREIERFFKSPSILKAFRASVIVIGTICWHLFLVSLSGALTIFAINLSTVFHKVSALFMSDGEDLSIEDWATLIVFPINWN